MKKIMILLSMATICMSCAKEMNPAGNEGQTPSASGAREFIATMENVGTKTALDADLNVKWSKGDGISIFDETGKNFKFETKSSGASVVFTQVTEGEMVGDVFYAMYPYREENSLDVATGEISTKMITAGYTASPGNFSKSWNNIMTAKTTNTELKFKNLASLVKFTVPEGLDLASFYFSATNCIASSVSVAVDESGIPSVLTRSTESYGSTIISPSEGSPLAAGTYYIPILPGTYKNFRLALTWASGTVTQSDAFSIDPFKAERNKIVNIGTLYDNREYYKWMTFENGVVNPIISWQQADLEVVDNPCGDAVNASAKVLKSDARALSKNIHGGFDFSIEDLNPNVLGRIKTVKFQMYVDKADQGIYFPRVQLSTSNKILPTSINGKKPESEVWTEEEFKSACIEGQWNTFVFTFDVTSVSMIKIRPMFTFAGGNVSANTGSRIVYLDNIGFSFVEE